MLNNHAADLTGNRVNLFLNGGTLYEIAILYLSANFSENRNGKRIPLGKELAGLNLLSLINCKLRAVDYGVSFTFPAVRSDYHDFTVTVQHHIQALGIAHHAHTLKFYRAIAPGMNLSLFHLA